MADNYWVGTDANWRTAANWSLGTVPVDTNSIFFDGRSVVSVTMTGAAGALPAGMDFPIFHVKSSYTGDIGTAAVPCEMGKTSGTTELIYEGTGSAYIRVGDGADGDATIPRVIMNSNGGTLHLESEANVAAGASAQFSEVICIQGTLGIEYNTDDSKGCVVTTLRITPKDNSAGNVTVNIEMDCYKDNGDVATNIYMLNGTLSTDSMIGVCEQYGGTINYGTDLGGSPETLLDIATLRIYDGAFLWLPDELTAGNATITLLHLYGGSFTSDDSTVGASNRNLNAKTIATAYIYAGAAFGISHEHGNITVTTLYNLGGTVTTDSGLTLGITYDAWT